MKSRGSGSACACRALALAAALALAGCAITRPTVRIVPRKLPRLPDCLSVARVEGEDLAYLVETGASEIETHVLDIEYGRTRRIGSLPLSNAGWSPSGERIALGWCDFEDATGTVISLEPFWVRGESFAEGGDWLAMPDTEGGLVAVAFPSGRSRVVLGPGSLNVSIQPTVLWSPDDWLAWPRIEEGDQEGQWRETLTLRPAREDASAERAWLLSEDIAEMFFQLVDWVPGTRLILAAQTSLLAGQNPAGMPLVTIDADSGQLTDLGVSMLVTPEAYAWHPSDPGVMAAALGESRTLLETGRLAVVDLFTGDVRYLTDEGLAAFEPAWSPDGTRIAFAGVRAVPDAVGEPEVLEEALAGRAIYVADLRSGVAAAVTDPGAAVDGWPQWSGAGTQLLYTRQSEGSTEVRRTWVDGARDERLADGLPDPICYFGGCGWSNLVAYHPRPAGPAPPGLDLVPVSLGEPFAAREPGRHGRFVGQRH